MAYIKTIEITGLFGEKTIKWNLFEDVNILGGKNGSGKSTIFRLCYTLLKNNVIKEIQDRYLFDLATRVDIMFSNGWKYTWTKLTDAPRNIDDITGQYSGMVFLDNSKTINQQAFIYDDKGEVHNDMVVSSIVDVSYLNSFDQFVATAKNLKDSTTERFDNPTMLDMMIQDQIIARNSYFFNTIAKHMGNTEEDIAVREAYNESKKAFEDVIDTFLPGYNQYSPETFEFIKKDSNIKFENLSSGEKQILWLLLTIFNQQKKQTVLFMDEPDLSMHIDWKEMLISKLHQMNPNMQLIVSTHAPSLITGWIDKVQEVEQITI